MKKSIQLLILILSISCKKSQNNFQGYVCNGKNPIKDVEVIESGSRNMTKTDKKGFFKLKRNAQDFIPDLIFQKKGFETDTVQLMRGGRELQKVRFLFLSDQSDTLLLKPLK